MLLLGRDFIAYFIAKRLGAQKAKDAVMSRILCQKEGGINALGFVFVSEDGKEDSLNACLV
ncbi:MAG: hypothetical protein Kow0090_22870 [Myxococcota bacterium]